MECSVCGGETFYSLCESCLEEIRQGYLAALEDEEITEVNHGQNCG